ncbi:hypothetical protein [Vandammella animalimorsus]|uniref:hypothetical protein n=1 Tax=Vandammella animalimorsus TaxID=2029117 RepID=UPI001557FEAE|nr:hypothetical protein [Vandammella animalimorsus]
MNTWELAAARSTQHAARSTQHAARSTQHAARSTQHWMRVWAKFLACRRKLPRPSSLSLPDSGHAWRVAGFFVHFFGALPIAPSQRTWRWLNAVARPALADTAPLPKE